MASNRRRSDRKRGSSSSFGEGESIRGTGHRSHAQTWDLGISGKQNKTLVNGTKQDRPVAHVLADSQLRPVVQGEVELPQGPIQWVVNSTPGGTCRHVEQELLDYSWTRDPDIVVVAAGTNNIGFGVKSLDIACRQFRSLLKTAHLISSKVIATSIVPRLDRKGRLVDEYNYAFAMVCREEGVTWHDLTDSFPTDETRLWARDGLHISECTGLPRFLRLLHGTMKEVVFPK